MSFIDNLRNLTEAFNDRNAAKTLSTLGEMARDRATTGVIDALTMQNLGAVPMMMNKGARLAENISDFRKIKNDDGNAQQKEWVRMFDYGDRDVEPQKDVERKKEDDLKDDQERSNSSNSSSSSSNSSSSSPEYDIDEMAGEFILGAWGNGQDRIDNMINSGYSLDDYNKIQQRVNEAYESGRDIHEWTNKANEKLKYW